MLTPSKHNFNKLAVFPCTCHGLPFNQLWDFFLPRSKSLVGKCLFYSPISATHSPLSEQHFYTETSMKVSSRETNNVHHIKSGSFRGWLSTWQREERCGLLPQWNSWKVWENHTEASAKDLKSTQQTEKHLFKKIYRNTLRTVRACDIWAEMTSSFPLPAQWGGDPTLHSCSQTCSSLSPAPSQSFLPGHQRVDFSASYPPPAPGAKAKSQMSAVERQGFLLQHRLHSCNGSSALSGHVETTGPHHPSPAVRCWLQARKGKLRGPQTAVCPSSPTSTQPLEQKVATIPTLSASPNSEILPGGRSWLWNRLLLSLPIGIDFTCNGAQRSLSLRALSRTVEVMVKGNWEEICGCKEETA